MPAGTAASRHARTASKRRLYPYATLLMSELTLILVYPFFNGFEFRDDLFKAFAVLVISAALYSVLGKGRITTLALLLGGPAIAIRVTDIMVHGHWLDLVAQILGLIFLVFVTYVLVWTIVSNPSVTSDTLAGAVSAYMLIGITFGVAYLLISHLIPGAFRDTVEPGKHITSSELTFFSFVTLTTVGYGDIVPWDAHARALAMIESVIGIMYPAVLISRLVGLHGRKREE